MFKSIDHVKQLAEKFSAGKIVPSRVLKIEGKGKKHAKHNLVFTGNVYRVLGFDNSHIFLVDFKEKELIGKDYFIRLNGSHKNLNLDGASYGKKCNCFISNYDVSDEECLEMLNAAVFGGMQYSNVLASTKDSV